MPQMTNICPSCGKERSWVVVQVGAEDTRCEHCTTMAPNHAAVRAMIREDARLDQLYRSMVELFVGGRDFGHGTGRHPADSLGGRSGDSDAA